MKVSGIFSSWELRTTWGAGLLVILVALLLCGCAGSGNNTPQTRPGPVEWGDLPKSVVQTARSQIGAGYLWGGRSPETGFDCSGLVWWVFFQNGVHLPRPTGEQVGAGRRVERWQLEPGDIVFFKSEGGLHAGIVTGEGTFVHSPKSGGKVREEPLGSHYWSQRFLEARRVI